MRVLLLLVLLAAAVRAQDREYPLPTRASVILSRGEKTYYVEGEQRIPWGCEISVGKDIRIVGRGPDAVLVVAGAFLVRGITDRLSTIENLRIEPDEKFQEIHLDMVDVRGSGGIVIPKDRICYGKVILESTQVHAGASIDLTLARGEVRFLNSMFMEPVHIRVTPGAGMDKAVVGVNLISNYYKAERPGAVEKRSAYSGFIGGLYVTGARNAVIRNNRLAGDKAEFVDCPALTFDGNKVNSRHLVIRHSENGRFRRTKIQKCDFFSDDIVLQCPAGRKTEKVVIDKCWFSGLEKEDEIHEKIIKDGHDDESCGVKALFRKINDRPLELAGRVRQE